MSAAGAAVAIALAAVQPPGAQPPDTQPPPSPLTASPLPAPAPDDSAPAEPLADEANGATVDQAYAAAQSRQGPLDGRWRLSDAGGAPLFDFQLTDPGDRPSPRTSYTARPQIEGAWRDLRRDGALGGAGVLTIVQREGDKLVIAFGEPGPAHPIQVILHRTATGGWSGEMAEVGATTIVFLERP